jgi:hypothetical protein
MSDTPIKVENYRLAARFAVCDNVDLMLLRFGRVRPSSTNLDNLPIVVLKEIISYVDIGHTVSVTQVNQHLHYTLMTDDHIWTFLLHSSPH